MTDAERDAFAKLIAVCRRLRGPDGCPWDQKQTLESMTPYLTEEAAESVEAIGNLDADHTAEELGDLAFLVIFCLELSRERWGVGLAEALDRAAEKLIRRHPHVYADAKVKDGADGSPVAGARDNSPTHATSSPSSCSTSASIPPRTSWASSLA